MCPIYFGEVKDTQKLRAFTYINDIPGWMRSRELAWLYLAAQEMDSIVEIGSWMGRSTDALLSGCKGTVWAVDHFKGNKNEGDCFHRESTKWDISKIFLGNVGHYKNLKLLKMDSLEAAKRFEEKSIDMVFIDGEHTYEEVMADIKAWLPKTKKLICGHDYDNSDKGVKRAVDEIFSDASIFDLIWIKPIKEVS